MSDKKVVPEKQTDQPVGPMAEALKNLDKDEKEIKEITGKVLGDLQAIDGTLYKYSPVPISKYPEMHRLIMKLSDLEGVMKNLKEGGDDIAQIILMGLKPNYPDITIAIIKETFDFSVYPRAIKLAINLNSFFAELKEVQEMINLTKEMSPQSL